MPLSLAFQSPPLARLPCNRFPSINPKSGSINIKLAHLLLNAERLRDAGSISCFKACKPDMLLEFSTAKSRSTGKCFSSSGNIDQEVVEVEDSTPDKGQIKPDSLEVESLITTICDTTSIAEVTVELGSFRLYVKRSTSEKNVASSVPSLPPVQTTSLTPISQSNGSAATTSLVVSNPTPVTSIQRIIDSASDEGLVIIQSPKVGLFRRSRTIKGNRAPPSCKEKQLVKEGQVVCFIEQLAGEIPIESDVTGEVIKILREDGEPVGYGDALIAILPSFPGINLQ